MVECRIFGFLLCTVCLLGRTSVCNGGGVGNSNGGGVGNTNGNNHTGISSSRNTPGPQDRTTVSSAATSKKNDAEEDSPKCDLTPCDRTESIPAGVAAGLVLAGVVIGVLVTSICCIQLTRLRIKPSGSFIGGHNNAPKQTSCENPLSGEMALTERNFAVVSLGDSNVYNELSVYNEPEQVPARALDASNDNYDHTNTPRALPRPPSDHANTYNQTYTPLVDQRGGRDKYYTVELQNATADKHREESGVKDGITKENALSGTLVRGEESAGTETADRNDGHVMHDYFVLEKKIKTKQDKDNTSDLVDGEDILKRNERGETADDNNAIQHDYFKLEKNGKEPGDTEGINKKETTHDGVIEKGEVQHEYFVLESKVKTEI